jgi:hypothetical protein
MSFIDETWLRKAHQALKGALEVDSNTRRDMIQFLFDEGFWDPEKLSWDAAIARWNACLNPTKSEFFKLGEIWALCVRFNRPQLLLAMNESMGYEARPIPTEARRIALMEQILAAQQRFEQDHASSMADLERLMTQPIEQRLPSLPGQRPSFSLPDDRTAVERVGAL